MLPEIILIEFEKVWNIIGPYIIGTILIILSSLIAVIVLNKIVKDSHKHIVSNILVIGIVVVFVIGFILASDFFGRNYC